MIYVVMWKCSSRVPYFLSDNGAMWRAYMLFPTHVDHFTDAAAAETAAILAVAKNPKTLVGRVGVQSLGEATTYVNVLKERRYAPHVGPEDCPHYYDGCHCAETEIEVKP